MSLLENLIAEHRAETVVQRERAEYQRHVRWENGQYNLYDQAGQHVGFYTKTTAFELKKTPWCLCWNDGRHETFRTRADAQMEALKQIRARA